MTELQTTYLGLELRSPIVASASPLTGRIEMLERLEGSGAGAVVLPSLFEEELVSESLRLDETLERGAEQFGESLGYFPPMDFDDLGVSRHLRLVEQAKRVLGIPVVASVNATRPGSWSRYVSFLADAGADAIELNVYAVPADPTRAADTVEAQYLAAIREVRAAVSVPLAVKLSPFFSAPAHFALQAVSAGADGLVLFNRFYQPDIDLETLDVQPALELSHSFEMRLPLRFVALLRPHLPATSLALTTGIQSGGDVAKALLAGADVAMTASALLRHGPEFLEVLEFELREFMDANGYWSVAQLIGSVGASGAADPSAFERAAYIRTLSSYRP